MMTAERETAIEMHPAGRGDGELVAACLKGDSDAWEALLIRYRRLIYSIPMRAQLGPDDAADVFQSVCLKLCEGLSTLRDPERLAAWLITTTTRECWRVRALRRRQNSLVERDDDTNGGGIDRVVDAAPLADEAQIALEQQQLVRESVEALQERCRDLITMLFYEKDQWSYDQIARRMKMPQASIGPTRARCLKKLQKVLESKMQTRLVVPLSIPAALRHDRLNACRAHHCAGAGD